MLRIAARMARHRLTSLIAVACAVLGGVALVTATGVLAESGIRSHAPAGRLAGADVVVTENQTVRAPGNIAALLPERNRIPSTIADDLADLPGVRRVVSDIGFPAALRGNRGQLVDVGDPRTSAHGWASVSLLGSKPMLGAAPSGAGEVALGSRAASGAQATVGDDVRIAAAGRAAQTYRVSAVLKGGAGGIFFADPVAAQLSQRGDGAHPREVDLIGLHVDKGSSPASVATDVRQHLRGSELIVSTGAERGDASAPEVAAARSILLLVAGSLAGIVLMLVGFVVAGALAISVAGQRRELALIRSIGGTPRQIRSLVAGEATTVALLAVVPGILLGYGLAGQLGRLLRAVDILPPALPLTMSPLPAVAAAVSMLAVVQVSARAASWRTSRMAPTEAIVEASSEARAPSAARTHIGLLLILAALTLSVAPVLVQAEIGAAATSTAGILAAVGLAVAGPGLLRRAADAMTRRAPAPATASTWLAMANMRVFTMRFAGVITASAMLMIFTLTYALSQTTLLQATSDSTRAGTLAQFRVTADQLGGVPPDAVQKIRGLNGVRDAAPVSQTSVVWPHRVMGDVEIEAEPAMILTPQAASVLDLDVRRGSLQNLSGNTIAVGTDVAGGRDAGLGRSVSLTLGDGTKVRARVVAVFARSLGFGQVALSHDLAEGHTTSRLDQSILVRADDSESAKESLAALSSSDPGLGVEETGADTDGSMVSPSLWLNVATIAVLLGYLGLTIANRIVAMTTQRRGEISALRIAGATRRQILAMTRREALIAGLASCIAALAVSAIPLALLGVGFLGRPWPAGPVWLVPATALLILMLIMATVELPTRYLLRSSPTAPGR